MRVLRLEALEGVTVALIALTVLPWAACGYRASSRCPLYPSITSVAPTTLRAVNADTAIRVKGLNFHATSYATFNGKRLTTMVESDTILNVLLDASEMSHPQPQPWRWSRPIPLRFRITTWNRRLAGTELRSLSP